MIDLLKREEEMKKLIFVLLLLSQAVFARTKYPDDFHTINWSDKKTLSYAFVQMCDDSYFPNLRIIVPGRISKNFTFKTDNQKLDIKINPLLIRGEAATELIIKGGDSATIEIQKSNSTLEAEIELSDAC
jgi:hypothetical protein